MIGWRLWSFGRFLGLLQRPNDVLGNGCSTWFEASRVLRRLVSFIFTWQKPQPALIVENINGSPNESMHSSIMGMMCRVWVLLGHLGSHSLQKIYISHVSFEANIFWDGPIRFERLIFLHFQYILNFRFIQILMLSPCWVWGRVPVFSWVSSIRCWALRVLIESPSSIVSNSPFIFKVFHDTCHAYRQFVFFVTFRTSFYFCLQWLLVEVAQPASINPLILYSGLLLLLVLMTGPGHFMPWLFLVAWGWLQLNWS